MTSAIRKHFNKHADWYLFLGAIAAWLYLLAAILTNDGWIK